MSETRGLDHWADILIIIIYLVAVISVGLWTLCRPNRGNVKSYFLAGRSMPWFAHLDVSITDEELFSEMYTHLAHKNSGWYLLLCNSASFIKVGASLFSSNIGSEHFVGLAGAGASSGIALACFELFTTSLFLILGWLFLPVYISAGVYTLPEYMEKRFASKRIRLYLSCFALVLYVITKLAVSIFAGSLFIQLSLGWNMYPSIVVLLTITGLYTVLGGLAAVMYTDTFQTAVMTLGAFAVVGFSYSEVGGYTAIEEKYFQAVPEIRNVNSTCGEPRQDSFHLFRDPVDGDFPWPGLVLQCTIGCLWYVCCDQVMVQRSLASKNITHAKGGSVLAASLKLLPLYIILFPGMISRILYPDEVACVDREECMKYCENPVGCSNIAYPKLVMALMPVGVRGLLMAVMMSAIMSSLTSIFNSSGTVFTMDIWRRLRPRASQRELLIVGRIFVVIMCGLSILWIPVVKSAQDGKLYIYITAVESYLGSPLGVLFLLSILWKRTTETAVFWGLVIAHVCGGIRLVLEIVYTAPLCGEPETRPSILYKLHYMYFSQLLLIFTLLLVVGISLITSPRKENEICLKSMLYVQEMFTLKIIYTKGSKIRTASVMEVTSDVLKPLSGLTWWTRYKPNADDKSTEEEELQDRPHISPVVNETGYMEHEADEESVTVEDTGPVKKLIIFLCGIQKTHETEVITLVQKKSFFIEDKIPRFILNLSAITVMGIVLFLAGFYH